MRAHTLRICPENEAGLFVMQEGNADEEYEEAATEDDGEDEVESDDAAEMAEDASAVEEVS